MTQNSIYTDYNANVPMRNCAKEILIETIEIAGNPSSIHKNGQKLRRIIENARKEINQSIGNISGELIFTSGATESAQLAIESATSMGFKNVFLNASEHDAVYKYALSKYPNAKLIPNDENGIADINWLSGEIEGIDRPLVILMAVNNETGVIQDIAKASTIARQKGGAILVDAVQAFGKIDASGFIGYCDWAILSGHKIGACVGVGAIIYAAGIEPSFNRPGGGQEKSIRSGTMNAPAIASFGKAAIEIANNIDENEKIKSIRDDFENKLQVLFRDVIIIGKNAKRIGNTSCFAIPNMFAEHLVISLDLDGICISAGSACSSGSTKVSRAIAALNLDEKLSKCFVRVSFGYQSDESHADIIIDAIQKAVIRAGKVAA
ncbi:MAG: aminotransferase class V-fold PLP-dependent enzyme [Caulobacterales bacterium]|nr:aminotransferase class V-fold PLP-dependent enzyme [Caulobacterales bacterium]MCA0373089.1 aminotransferase class V-fold PLP-dependent enzyme [Pseudomonadota bacterium]